MNQKQLNYQQRNFDNRNNVFLDIAAIIIFTLVMSGLTSCISQKRVDKICATCPTETTIRIDSVTINTIDTIYRTSKLDSLIFMSSIDLTKQIDTVYFEDETWKASIYVTNNKLKAKIEHLSDSISTIIKTKETTVKQAEKQIIKVPVEKIVPKYNKWYYFLLIWFVSSIVFICGWVWIQWEKGKIKWLVKFKN